MIYSSYKTKFLAFVYFPVIIILVIINWHRLYCVVPENIHLSCLLAVFVMHLANISPSSYT